MDQKNVFEPCQICYRITVRFSCSTTSQIGFLLLASLIHSVVFLNIRIFRVLNISRAAFTVTINNKLLIFSVTYFTQVFLEQSSCTILLSLYTFF